MRQIFFLLFILIIFSCDNDKPVDYSKLDKLSELDEKVLVDFYKNVLDTLIGENYLYSIPYLETDLIDKSYGLPLLSDSDQDFFQLQTEKFKEFRWKDYLIKEKILSQTDMDSTFKNGAFAGWEVFREKYSDNCICTMSLPLFSKDFKKVYIDFGTQCAATWGWGQIYVFEFKNGKWSVLYKFETWIS